MVPNTKGKNIINMDNLATDIIRKLKQHVELPKIGLLAGGAVANTILSMEWGGDYPINDLDIFQIESIKGLKSKKMPHRHMGMDLFIDVYKERFDLWVGTNGRRAYTVSRARRNGLLNLIDVQLTRDHQNPENYKIILQGFDLNSCQVGIDLETEKLIYSPNFESFVKTMQLQVNHPCTPFHTAIRIAKKKKELQCYCNNDAEFKYLSQIPLILTSEHKHPVNRNTEFAEYFGKHHHNLYLQYKDEIDKYFEVVNKAIPNGNTAAEIFTMIPRDSTVIDELKDCYNLNTIKATWELLQGKRASRDKNIKALKLGRYFKDSLMVNPKYAQCDWNEKHALQIEEFLNQHFYMETVFMHFNLNLQDQLNAVRTIKRIANKEGLYVIGLIEEAIRNYLRDGDPSRLPSDNAITEEWIRSLIDVYLTENSELLKAPEDLTDFEFANYFTELLTGEDLATEGIRMNHCVGGYAGIIKSGGSAIFHLEAVGEPSTIEISKFMEYGVIVDYSVRQHRGPWNKEPSPFHKRRGRDLANYLKEQLDFKKPVSGGSAYLVRRFREVYGLCPEKGMAENSACL